MTSVLLDTHTLVWTITDTARLSPKARTAISEAHGVFVSAISLYEIGQKVRLKKWPEAEPLVSRLPYVILDSGIKIVGIDEVQSLGAGLMDWAHRDPFDRLVAAAALEQRLVLVSIDTAFDGVVDRIW